MSITTRRHAARIASAATLIASLSVGESSPAAASSEPRPARSDTTRSSEHQAEETRAGGSITVSRSSTTARPPLIAKAQAERLETDTETLAGAEDEAITKAREQSHKDAEPSYPDNLDGWIREARAIMAKHDIPGSYDGIKRNIMRESSGDPNAVNNTDINAQNGTPSKGLLQVIKPTFDAYHVDGTPHRLTDPVANIAAACNYAADQYGSMDNVNSAY